MRILKLLVFIGVCLIANNGFAQTLDTLPTEQPKSFIIKSTYPPVFGFYTKLLMYDGIPIRSSDTVADKALEIAYLKMERMLSKMFNVKRNLIENEVEFHVIGKDQKTNDLPEIKNRPRTGNGGIMERRGEATAFASCGEENLLNLPSDEYGGGYDIFCHEFAHVIMNFGLDVVIRTKIEKQYQKAIAAGLWKGAYAAEDPQEYWAELSTWYFGYHGDYVRAILQKPQPGPEGLRRYDIGGFKLVDSVYSGKIAPNRIQMLPALRVNSQMVSTKPRTATELTIINNTSLTFKLLVIGLKGSHIPVANILPYSHYVAQTYKTTVVQIESEAGSFFGYFKAVAPHSKLIIPSVVSK